MNNILAEVDDLIYTAEGMGDLLRGAASEFKFKRPKLPSKQSVADTLQSIRQSPGKAADTAAHAAGTYVNSLLTPFGSNLAAKTVATAEDTRKALKQQPKEFYTAVAKNIPNAAKEIYKDPNLSHKAGKEIAHQAKDELIQTLVPFGTSIGHYGEYVKNPKVPRRGILGSFRDGVNLKRIGSGESNNLLNNISAHL